jgi:hypothetical protein
VSHCNRCEWTDAVLDSLNAEYAPQYVTRTLQTQAEVDAVKADNPELAHIRIGHTIRERVPSKFIVRSL